MNKKKFGVRDQIGYALGDVGGSLVNLYIDAFFLTFATYVLGVSPFFMGSLFLVARVWDAFSDVLMGQIPDRWTIGKSGDKFKPYIKIAMWALALSGVLAFVDVSGFSTTMIHVWISAVYIFYGMAYTAVSIPYGSMATVITQDSVERTKLSRARSLGGMIVGIGAISLVPLFIFDEAGNTIPKNFLNVAIVFSILSIVAYFGLLKLTTERIREEAYEDNKTDYKFTDALKAVAKNRPLIGVMVASIGSLLQITASNQLGAHIFKEYYGYPQALSINLVLSVVVMLILFPVIPKIVDKFGKRKTVLIGGIYSLIMSALLFLIPIPNVYLFILLFGLGNAGFVLFTMVVWAVVTDCIDYSEYITGKKYDGTIYSIYTFSRKLGSALASTIASFGLGLMGFVSGVENQAPEVAEKIRSLYTAMPLIASILIIIGMGLIYNLTTEKTENMYNTLKTRRTK